MSDQLFHKMMQEYLREHPRPGPTAADRASAARRDQQYADELRTRDRQRQECSGILEPGTVVKPSITWIPWCIVLDDPGPDSNPDRTITIGQMRAGSYEPYRVKRHMVKTDSSGSNEEAQRLTAAVAAARAAGATLPTVHSRRRA